MKHVDGKSSYLFHESFCWFLSWTLKTKEKHSNSRSLTKDFGCFVTSFIVIYKSRIERGNARARIVIDDFYRDDIKMIYYSRLFEWILIIISISRKHIYFHWRNLDFSPIEIIHYYPTNASVNVHNYIRNMECKS